MWTRIDLKNRAKANLTNKYWTAFIVVLIIIGIEIAVGALASVIPFVSLLVMPVISVGVVRWYSRSREAPATPAIDIVFSLFRDNNYGRTLGSMLWMYLFLFLWGLLASIPVSIGFILFFIGILTNSLNQSGGSFDKFDFHNYYSNMIGDQFIIIAVILVLAAILLSIPAIIKSYSYRLTPWILADNPQIGYQRALKLSIDLTRGQKMDIFVLDLSFIGWGLLCVLTCGIGFLFLAPYFYATQAELYAVIRQNGVDSGLCTMEELGFSRVNQTINQNN